MRYALIPLAVATAVAVLPPASAGAAAYPVKSRILTDNPLYDAGPLATTSCPEKPVKRLSLSSAKSYLNGVRACLDRTWAAHLRKADIKFSKPKFVYAAKPPKKYCGEKWDKEWLEFYCADSRTVLLLIEKDLLEEPEDLFLFNLIAMDYGRHVQNLAGIERAYEKIPYRNKSEMLEQDRRYSVQSDCLAGAFIGSVWDSLDRDKEDWADLLSYIRDWAGKTTGTRKTITYWAERGFKSGDPGSCDTWSAPSSRVA
ncbi:neutral zinc metallopeptidase [Sphaerisporangium aureirubrum]|uniref:Neutral zinc metallopeptidase n=1 Tax=Sphaerisporangium aureirubrum TaxID=1544736 RepID=A0ABW1NJ50_9ACTN